MPSRIQLVFAILASTAIASPLEARSGLVKRMFWCDGVDSHTICAPGQRMVPMEEASCQVLRDAGRLNDASPPAAGESFFDCGHDDSAAGGDASTGGGDTTPTTTTADASSTTAAASSTTAATTDVPDFPAGGNTTTTPEDPAQGTSEGDGSTTGSDQGTTGGTSGGDMGGTTGTTTGGTTEDTKSADTDNGRQFIPMVCEKIDGVIGQWESLNCTKFKGADGGQWALGGK